MKDVFQAKSNHHGLVLVLSLWIKSLKPVLLLDWLFSGRKDVFVQSVMHIFLHANPIIIYCLVAVILLLESTAVPIANTTILLLTGALVAAGHLNPWVLGSVAILGSVAGASIAYGLGAYRGRRVLLRLASIFRVEEQKVLIAEQWCRRSGVWMVFFSRMTPYIRPFACIPAGIAAMRFPRFLLAATAGSSIWCVTMLSIGLLLGHRWTLALVLIQHYTLPTLVGTGVLLIGALSITRLLKRRIWARSRSALQATVATTAEAAEREPLNI